MSASPAEEGTDERDEALDMLLAVGVGGLELSGRLAGVVSSWVGDLLGSLGSGGGWGVVVMLDVFCWSPGVG